MTNTAKRSVLKTLLKLLVVEVADDAIEDRPLRLMLGAHAVDGLVHLGIRGQRRKLILLVVQVLEQNGAEGLKLFTKRDHRLRVSIAHSLGQCFDSRELRRDLSMLTSNARLDLLRRRGAPVL